MVFFSRSGTVLLWPERRRVQLPVAAGGIESVSLCSTRIFPAPAVTLNSRAAASSDRESIRFTSRTRHQTEKETCLFKIIRPIIEMKESYFSKGSWWWRWQQATEETSWHRKHPPPAPLIWFNKDFKRPALPDTEFPADSKLQEQQMSVYLCIYSAFMSLVKDWQHVSTPDFKKK